MSQISRRGIMTAGSGLTLATAIGLARPAWAQEMGRVVAVDAYSYMLQDPRLTDWVQLIGAGGLENAARTAIYTAFPPTDSAFGQFPGMVRNLLGYQSATGSHNAQSVFPDNSRIVKLVRSLVVTGKHFASEVMGKQVTLTTVSGTALTVDGTDPKAVKISWTSIAGDGEIISATLVEPPVTTVNAVLYIINKVEKM